MQVFLIVNLREEFVRDSIERTFSTSPSAFTFLKKVIGDKNLWNHNICKILRPPLPPWTLCLDFPNLVPPPPPWENALKIDIPTLLLFLLNRLVWLARLTIEMFMLVTLLILLSNKKYSTLGLLHIESKLERDLGSSIATHNKSTTKKLHQNT